MSFNRRKKYDLLYCMGDSFVHGYGQSDDIKQEITVENRFTNLVANHYGLRCVNNASAGTNNEYIARTVYSDILKLKSKGKNPLVFVAYTDPWRTEIYSNKFNMPMTINEDSVSFFKEYMVDNYNFQYAIERSIYNALSVKTMLNYCNFDFVDAWNFDLKKIPYINNEQELNKTLSAIAGSDRYTVKIDGYSRLGHPNLIGHQKIADAIIEKINGLYGTN